MSEKRPLYNPGDKVIFTITQIEKNVGGGIAGYTIEPFGYFVPLKYQGKLQPMEEKYERKKKESL